MKRRKVYECIEGTEDIGGICAHPGFPYEGENYKVYMKEIVKKIKDEKNETNKR